jgi:hypothetical protein
VLTGSEIADRDYEAGEAAEHAIEEVERVQSGHWEF